MKKKKILGILPSYSGGGAEKIMLTYFQNIEKRPFFYKLIVLNNRGPLKKKLANVEELSYKRFIYSIPHMLFHIKKNKYDIIFSTFPHISLALVIMKLFRFHNCNIVVRQPNMLHPSLSFSWKLRLIRFLYIRLIRHQRFLF